MPFLPGHSRITNPRRLRLPITQNHAASRDNLGFIILRTPDFATTLREVSALQTTILFSTRQQSTKPEQITLIGSLSRLTPETSGKEPGRSTVRIEPVKSGNIARRSRNCSKSTALTCSPQHVSGMWWLMCSQTSRGRSMGTLSSHARICRPTATSA